MDNTYKVWDKRTITGWHDDFRLATDGSLYREQYPLMQDAMEFITVCHAVGIKDKNGTKLYAGDIIQNGNTQYIIQWSKWSAQWEAWDFKAWAQGYYDAYIPLHEVDGIGDDNCEPPCFPYPQFYNMVKVGSVYETPELCPEIFDADEVKS